MEFTAYFKTLFGYHYSLYDRIWESVNHLSEAQFIQDNPYSRGSIRNQLIHVANTDAGWLRGIKEIPDARAFRLDPLEYPTRSAARVIWVELTQGMKDYIGELDEEELHRIPAGMGGPTWQILTHLVNHGTDHRAQILTALTDFGAPTFDQDMIFYLWPR